MQCMPSMSSCSSLVVTSSFVIICGYWTFLKNSGISTGMGDVGVVVPNTVVVEIMEPLLPVVVVPASVVLAAK